MRVLDTFTRGCVVVTVAEAFCVPEAGTGASPLFVSLAVTATWLVVGEQTPFTLK